MIDLRESTLKSMPDKITRIVWVLFILFWLADLYVFINFILYNVIPPEFGFFPMQPLLYLSLLGVSWLGYRRLANRPWLSHRLVIYAGLAGLAQAVVFLGAGIFFHFGSSPYGHDLAAILQNVFYITAVTLGIEMSRAFLGAALGTRHADLSLASIAILFTLLMTPVNQFSLLSSPSTAFVFLAQSLLPALARNLLATFLAMTVGPWAAAAYMGSLVCFEWLLPVLPQLPWQVVSALGTLFPIAVLFFFNSRLVPENKKTTIDAVKNKSTQTVFSFISWPLVISVGMALFGFSSGLFGVQPFVIYGSSMKPILNAGDIVVTRPVNPTSLLVGDVIRFHQGSIEVVHRIITIRESQSDLVFITRGDNNNTNDSPVRMSEVHGKVVWVIPKVGLVSLVVRELFTGIFRL